MSSQSLGAMTAPGTIGYWMRPVATNLGRVQLAGSKVTRAPYATLGVVDGRVAAALPVLRLSQGVGAAVLPGAARCLGCH